MRDIRPQGSGAERRDRELYEASAETKREARRRVDVASIQTPPRRETRPAAAPRPPARQPERVGSGERKLLLAVFGLVVLAGGIAAFLFLPTATIVLRLKTAPLLVDEEVTISTTGGVAASNAFFREVAVSGVIPVETTEKVGTTASGTVTLINASSQEQAIKEQSRLVTDDGRLFFMQKHAIVPPNSRALVPVAAAEAGEEGNLAPPQRLNFAALDAGSQQLIYAEVTQELTGGTGEVISVVGDADIERARQNAGETAKAQVEPEIRKELPDGWNIIEESWTGELNSFETTAAVGDKTPELSYTAAVVVRVMGFEQEQLLAHLQETITSHLDAEFMLFPSPISYTKSVKDVNWEAGEAALAVRVTHTTIPNLNLPTLKEKLAGRSAAEAAEYLEGLPGVLDAEAALWPFWVQSIPRIEQRISLTLTPERQP